MAICRDKPPATLHVLANSRPHRDLQSCAHQPDCSMTLAAVAQYRIACASRRMTCRRMTGELGEHLLSVGPLKITLNSPTLSLTSSTFQSDIISFIKSISRRFPIEEGSTGCKRNISLAYLLKHCARRIRSRKPETLVDAICRTGSRWRCCGM